MLHYWRKQVYTFYLVLSYDKQLLSQSQEKWQSLYLWWISNSLVMWMVRRAFNKAGHAMQTHLVLHQSAPGCFFWVHNATAGPLTGTYVTRCIASHFKIVCWWSPRWCFWDHFKYSRTFTNGNFLQRPPLYDGHFFMSWQTVYTFTLISTSLQQPPLHNGNGH